MCERHSFCLTRAAKIIDGCGLTDSHTNIMDMHGLTAAQHDACNLYEWQPPAEWPIANWADGLKVDRGVFETKLRHDQAAERHVRNLYPDAATWAAPDVIRWSELPLPDAERVHRAYDLALRAAPLAIVDDETVLAHVNRHLAKLGCKEAVKVVNATDGVRGGVRDGVWDSVWGSVWASVWASVWDSVWDSVPASVWARVLASVRASVRDGVWDGVWDSVRNGVWDSVFTSMVRDDAENPFLALSELAAQGCYLYGVADDGTAYVSRGEAE